MKNASISLEILGRDGGAIKLLDALNARMSLLQSSSSTFLKTMGLLVAAVGVAFVAAAGAGVKQAVSFEKAIDHIAAVAGGSSAEVDELAKKALELGAKTVFSANEAAQAMEELVKSGLSLREIQAVAAEATLNLAAAGSTTVEAAAKIVATAKNSFQLSGQEITNAVDLIAGAANASVIDVHDFGLAMAQSSAVAAQAGLKFHDMAVAIALMGQAGIRGSDAGTSLKTMLLQLNPASDKQIALFRELGIITEKNKNRFFDAAGNVKSLADISGVLNEATKDMSKEQKLAALEIMFGTDAIRAASVMATQGADGFHKMSSAMVGVKAADVARQKLDNVSGALERLKSVSNTLAIVFGTQLLGGVRFGLEAVIKFLEENVAKVEEIGRAVGTVFNAIVMEAVAGISAFLAGLSGDFSGQLTPLANGVRLLGSAIRDVAEAIQTFASGDVEGALTQIWHVIGRTFGPVAAALITGAIREIYSSVVTFLGALSGDWQPAEGITDLPLVFGLIGMAIKDAVEIIGQVLQGDLEGILERATKAFWQFVELTGITLDGLIPIFWKWIQPAADALMAEIPKIWTAIESWFLATLPLVQAQLLIWGNAFWEWVQPMIPLWQAEAAKYAGIVLAWLAEQVPIWLEYIITYWVPLFLNWMAKLAIDIIPKLLDFSEAVFKWIATSGAQYANRILAEWIPVFVVWLLEAGIRILPKLADFMALITAWIVTKGIPALADATFKMGTAIVTGVIEGVARAGSRLISKMVSLAKEALQAAMNAIGARSPSTEFRDKVGIPMVDGIIAGIDQAAPDLTRRLRRLADDAVGIMQSADLQIPSPIIESGGRAGRRLVEAVDQMEWLDNALSKQGTSRMVDLPANSVDDRRSKEYAGVSSAPVTVNVSGSVVTERQLVEAIHSGLLAKKRQTGALGLL